VRFQRFIALSGFNGGLLSLMRRMACHRHLLYWLVLMLSEASVRRRALWEDYRPWRLLGDTSSSSINASSSSACSSWVSSPWRHSTEVISSRHCHRHDVVDTLITWRNRITHSRRVQFSPIFLHSWNFWTKTRQELSYRREKVSAPVSRTVMVQFGS